MTPPRSCAGDRILAVLLAWNALLLALGAYFQFTWDGLRAPYHLREVFLVGTEQSIVTWTSVVTVCALGIACLYRGAQTGRWAWRLAGVFFLYLSLDDQAMLHERFGWTSSAEGGAVHSWLVVVLPWLALTGAWVLWSLWRETRGTPARPRVLQTGALWALAVVLELVEKPLDESGATWNGVATYRYFQWIEEACELMAPALLLTGILAVIRGTSAGGPRAAGRSDDARRAA